MTGLPSKSNFPIITITTTVVLLSGSALGCERNLDPAGAEAFQIRLAEAPGYEAWAKAPDYDQPQPTVGAHGDTATVYVNDVVSAALEGEASLDAWPQGSVIVKDSFDDEGKLYRVAAMEKREGGWYWVEWDGEGRTLYSGSPETCTRCHASGDDSTLAIELP